MIFGNHFDRRPRVRIVRVNGERDVKFLGELGYVTDQAESGLVWIKLDNYPSEKLFWYDQVEIFREEAFGVIGSL